MSRILTYCRQLSLRNIDIWPHLDQGIKLEERFLKRSISQRGRTFCDRPKDKPKLTLYTKSNGQCSLCITAKDELEDYMGLVNFEEVYIDEPGNEEWKRKYQYDIPVFHFNGEYLMKHSAKPELLEKALANHNKDK